MLSVSGLLAERSEGTMARLLATPTPRSVILIGKLAAGVVVAAAAMAVLVGVSTLVLGADWGDPRGVAALLVAVALAATGLMAVVATFAPSTEQATNWMSVISVVLGLFGGSFVPLAQLGVLAPISYLTPHRWFLRGISDLSGGGLSVVAGPVAVLLGFAALGFAVALLRAGKVVRP
jgi:ABC-2 type transport system permease protein